MTRDRSNNGRRLQRWSAHFCWAIVVAVLLAACGSNAQIPRATPPPSVDEGTAFVTVWFAGLRIAADPNDLDADTQALLDLVDKALVVSPVQCFEGLPDDVAKGGGYVLGVTSESKAELDRLVAETGREPLFVVHVRDFCVH